MKIQKINLIPTLDRQVLFVLQLWRFVDVRAVKVERAFGQLRYAEV